MRHRKDVAQTATPGVGSFFLCWQSAHLVGRRRSGGYAVAELATEREIAAQPGQFLMARTEGGPALPRPLSLLWSAGNRVAFLVKDEGLLRARLAEAPRGTRFEVRGPYGVPFLEAVDPNRQYILVGGGSGIAPLQFFWQRHPELVESVVFGLRRATDAGVLPDTPVLVEEQGQGSAGAQALSLWRPGLGMIACGPKEMFFQLADGLPDRRGVYVALEERMGCAYGACQGCVVMTREGPCRLCLEGPLLPLERLPW
ncbi:MAG: hypothetical protein R6U88_07465 [Candidatus Bipolaricaulota bacterium]